MPDVGLEKFRIFIFILYPMLTVSNYSGVGKSHPRRGLFNSFGSRSGKVNYRWDLLDIDFVFFRIIYKKKIKENNGSRSGKVN